MRAAGAAGQARTLARGKGTSREICEGTTIRTYSPHSSAVNERYLVRGGGSLVREEQTTEISIKGRAADRGRKREAFNPWKHQSQY